MTEIRELNYSFDGLTFRGELARPDTTGPVPAILVVHEAPGLTDHMRRRIRMLADLGYAAFAADLHGEGALLTGGAIMERVGRLRADVPYFRDLVRAAYQALVGVPEVDQDRIAAIGYCFGGGAVLELARSGAPLSGIVSFHGWLHTTHPAAPDAITGPVLALTGAKDPIVPDRQVSEFGTEMAQAGVDWQVVTFGDAHHAFTNRDAAAAHNPALVYDADADRRSWSFMQVFLADIFSREKSDTAAP